MMQQTSLFQYAKLVTSGRLNANQTIVRDYFNNQIADRTAMECARDLGWSINRVTPRILELRKKGALIRLPARKCGVTGNMSHSYVLKGQMEKWYP